MTTMSGRSWAAWASRTSVEVCAASATTRNRSGWPSRTSTACVPIEPVDPSRLTVRISSPEVESFDHEVRGGQDEEKAVHPVQDAAMARHQPAHVLHAQMALDHRLAEVPDRRHHGHDDTEYQRLADGPRVDEVHHYDGDQHRGDGATHEAFQGLVRADRRCERVTAEGRAHQERGDVGGH